MTDTSEAAKERQRWPEGPFSDGLLDVILGRPDGQDVQSL